MKPLIEQLAERAGIPAETVADRRLLFNQQLSAILFELCAYLDEREQPANKRKPFDEPGWCGDHQSKEPCIYCFADSANSEPPSVRINDEGECPNCWLPDGHEGACDHPTDANWKPPAAPEVAEPRFRDLPQALTRISNLEFRNTNLAAVLAEARAELASRCDHHAAIHELTRELVEAREALVHAEECNAANVKHAVAQYNKLQRVRREIRRLNAVMRNSNTDRLSREERTRELGAAHRAELAKVTAERDELKTALAWEKAWDLHTKVAMGAVVEAARRWLRSLSPHCNKAQWDAFADGNSLHDALAKLDALTAAAAKPPER